MSFGHSLVVCALLGSAVILGIIWVHAAKHRSRVLKRAADGLGFRFTPVAKPFEGEDVDGVSILEDGVQTEVENLMERSNGRTMLVFDALESAESLEIVTIVAAFHSDGTLLPRMRVIPKDMLRRMEEVFGNHGVPLEGESDFAHHFLIESQREREACTFLDHGRVAAITHHAAHLTIETSPHWVFIYRHASKLKGEELSSFISLAEEIASALLAPTAVGS